VALFKQRERPSDVALPSQPRHLSSIERPRSEVRK
jgi:hypothetical protein